jgi:hypothetical protein
MRNNRPIAECFPEMLADPKPAAKIAPVSGIAMTPAKRTLTAKGDNLITFILAT